MSAPAMYCRACGKALTDDEKATPGTIYCSACAPASPPEHAAGAPPPPPAAAPLPPSAGISPGLAFLLGLIPGVGAIYNGQYAKGLIHVFVFGILISAAGAAPDGTEALLGLMVMAWYVYMPFEAFHTARRRLSGEQVDEFSGIVSLHGDGGFPVAPVIMIAAGVFFLLNNLGILSIREVIRYWPVLLIGLGVYLLWVRLSAQTAVGPRMKQEAGNEQ